MARRTTPLAEVDAGPPSSGSCASAGAAPSSSSSSPACCCSASASALSRSRPSSPRTSSLDRAERAVRDRDGALRRASPPARRIALTGPPVDRSRPDSGCSRRENGEFLTIIRPLGRQRRRSRERICRHVSPSHNDEFDQFSEVKKVTGDAP